MDTLILGSRGSQLALWQARHVSALLREAVAGLEVRVEIIRTTGDRVQNHALHEIGGKGLFTKEIEDALLAGQIDLAVHSLKDLPTEFPPELTLGAVPAREDPADVLVGPGATSLDDLPHGAVVLTGSLRREAQVRHRRGDLQIEGVRGNVETRLRKRRESGAAALVLARAGLVRLDLADEIACRLDPTEFLPACGQGALGIEIREGDSRVAGIVQRIEVAADRYATTAERAMLAELGGGCQAPVGAFGRFAEDGQTMTLTGMVADPDGRRLIRREQAGSVTGDAEADALGRALAREIIQAGGREILDAIE